MHTSGQVPVDKYCPRQSQRKRQIARRKTTVLWRLMEKVKLLLSKLCVAVHRSSTELRPVSIAWSVAFIGALEQLRDSSCVSEEKSLKKFFCNRFCGQNVDLDREGAGDPTVARSLSCARSFTMSVSARSLVWRERKSNLEKAAEEFCSSGRPLGFFSLHCETVRNELFFHQWCRWYRYGERFLTITCRISFVECRAYFWCFVCSFRTPALIFKKYWTRNIKNKRHALTLVKRG